MTSDPKMYQIAVLQQCRPCKSGTPEGITGVIGHASSGFPRHTPADITKSNILVEKKKGSPETPLSESFPYPERISQRSANPWTEQSSSSSDESRRTDRYSKNLSQSN
jgi:hypothetical protein